MGTPPIETANISMGDTLLLMVIALVVLGPRRLPQISRQIGKLMYEFRKASNDFKFQMEEELRQSEEADRRKKEEEERKRVLAAAPAAAQIAAPAERTNAKPASTEVPEPQASSAAPEPPAEIAADESAAMASAETMTSDTAAPSDVAVASGISSEETSAPRILPPVTGEIVPAERPGVQPRQRELFAVDDGKPAESVGQEKETAEAERSEPATQHAEHHG